jgi:PAS domain S-box-containing protein
MSRQRRHAAMILRASRDEIVSRWMQRVRLLTRERGVDRFIKEQVLRDEAREFIDTLLARLEDRAADGDVAVFYHLILDGQQYHVRLADIAYVLLELKSVSKQVIFEQLGNELEAFRVSRLVDDSIEAVLRKSADLYELTTEADQKTAQERLQEIFAAWDIEESLAAAQSPTEVCQAAGEKLRVIWRMAGLRIRLCGTAGEQPRDMTEGRRLPMPLIEEMGQGLARDDQQAGGTVSVLDWVARRRESFICSQVTENEQLINAPELLRVGVQSLACCPLVARDQVLGAMLLYGLKLNTFLESDARRLRDFAGVLALALDRTGRLERSRKEISEAEVIARNGRSLLELPTQEELLEGVVDALRAFRDYFSVSLFRVDEEAGVCHLVAEAGLDGKFRPPDYTQKISEGYIGLCVRTGTTIRSVAPDGDPRRLVAFPEELRARSELTVPVKKGGQVLGVMHVLSERHDDFPESELAALEHVAPHIGVALENARMLRQRRHDRYELEQAHRQLANIIRSAAVGITVTDTEGVYTHWSPSCETMLGYSEGEVVGIRTPVDFAAEPYDLAGSLRRCLREGRVSAERRMLRKDGRARIVRETRVPVEDEQGRHVGFTSYLVDITEQKRAEEQLRRERDTLSLLVDAMGAGLALYDTNLRMQWANSALMQWLGFTADGFGKQCRDVYDCGRDHWDNCPFRRSMISGQPVSRVIEITDESGAWHCFQQVCTPVAHGETRLVVVTFDITEQRRQTEQLRLINKLTEKVETTLDIERVLHLVLTCVTAGHAIGFNRAFMFLLSENGVRLEGKMAVGPVSAADAHRIWSGLDDQSQTIDQLLDAPMLSESDSLLTQRTASLSIPLEETDDTLISTLNTRTSAHVGDARSDPHIRPDLAAALQLAEFVCVPLAVQDEPLGVMLADNTYSSAPVSAEQVELLEIFSRQASLAIANALAYQKIRDQLEELQQTRDRLIEAERMASVGRMASHLAHEIRNPLTAIGGFAGSIARQHQHDAKTHRKARIIFDEVRRLERTLVNVLDYTRPLRPRKRPVSVNAIVRETAEQFRAQTRDASIAFSLDLDETLPQIVADGAMIKQVVINLVKNAVEAVERREDGEVVVATQAAGDDVKIIVSDNGPGVEEETVDELFSPFFTTKIGGIGVGLSVSQRIVRQHGGTIAVESERGVGSRFIISLTIADDKAESTHVHVHSVPSEPDGKGKANGEDPTG